jgi:predicted transposase/invertase (TIGR01784 family)
MASMPKEELSLEEELEFREAERKGLLPEEINRFGDHFLKFLLAAPKHKRLLLDLLNTILRLMEYEALEDIEPVDRELSPETSDGKGVRLDYLGRTASGRTVNLEFQKRGNKDFVKRALYCGSTIIHRQLRSGGDYGNLCQTIFVALLDFSLFKEKDGWYWDFVLTHGKTGKVLTRDLLLMFVEMNKVQKILSGLRRKAKSGELDGKELTTRLALWGGYVTNKGVDIVFEAMAQDEVFSQVIKAERDFWGDSRNRFIQMQEEKRERDALSELASATRKGLAKGLLKGEAIGLLKGRTEGEAAGLLKGEAIGLTKGEEIGLAKGEEIGLTKGIMKNKFSVARSMLADGLPLEVVAKYSELSVEEVASLRMNR